MRDRGLIARIPCAYGVAQSTAARTVPIPPAMSATVAVAGQSTSGTHGSEVICACWRICSPNNACWSGWAARYSQ